MTNHTPAQSQNQKSTLNSTVNSTSESPLKSTLGSPLKFAAVLFLAASLLTSPMAMAMDAVDVTLVRHASNRYWVMQSEDNQVPDGYLVGINEKIVDQLEALDTKTSHACKMKYRRALIYNAPGIQTLMVYGLDCRN